MAESFDFQINDLKFRAATSDRFPYARATAPFRKEQFDAAPTVGDQSLSGWWTRGQLSFHKGAGVKYYEVLDGDAILDRYDDSLRVEVSEPGKATLVPALVDLGVAATKAVPGSLSGSEGMFALTSTGIQFYDGSAPTGMSTSDGGVPTDITSDGRYYYTCNGNKIERQSSTALARTNHVTNPSFEVNTTGWLDGIGTIARNTTVARTGTASLKVTPNASGDASPYVTVSGLTVGQVYKASIWVYLTAAGGSLDVWGSLAGTNPDSAVADTTVVNSWQNMYLYFTADDTSESFGVVGDGLGGPMYLDSAMVTESPFDGTYFDGDSTGGAWTGTAHASKSTYASSAAGSSNVLWEHEQPGVTWDGVWWAKGRLWAFDSAGRWFMLSTAGGTVDAGDAFWASGKLEGGWTLAEGASAIYMAIDTDIYSVTLETDGAVPTVAVPPVAATVPLNETISHIDYYLGVLVICTDAGIRVGATGNGGEIIYGPIVVDGDFSSANAIGKRDTRVYVVGVPDGHDVATVCAVDLGNDVADLQPAWYPYHEVGATTSTMSGATFSSAGDMYAWAASALYGAGGTLAATSYLKTGLHRFGTLEGKHFSAVKVRVGGDGGTIKVYSVLQGGTETLLSTIDVTLTSGADVPLSLDAPAEAVGLKFELLRDATDVTVGPELLGYQIKALPSPVRQRLIKWPLMIQDVVRDRYGVSRGTREGAWTAWSELEALEETDALVTFTDHRTGETGEAFIESLELQTDTPTRGAESGFGGVGYITLRKVG